MIFLYRPVLNYHQIFTQYCVLTPQIEMLPAAFVNVQYASIMTSFRPTNLSTTPRKYTSHATLHLNVLLQKYGLALQAISHGIISVHGSLSLPFIVLSLSTTSSTPSISILGKISPKMSIALWISSSVSRPTKISLAESRFFVCIGHARKVSFWILCSGYSRRLYQSSVR